jgi:hypothetical protein
MNVGLHLLVAILPFLHAGQINGFWQYNKSLFLRFLLAVLYSAVLFMGLAIALLALDKLLGIHVDDDQYLRLWIVVAMVFNTWFFLGGIPPNLTALDQVREYPRGLKIFAQYILIPLVILYLVILTIYLGKVLVTRTWPSGWIGYLVSSVSIAGILSLLLVHPVKDETENKWVRTFSKWFYVFLLPSIAMLMIAIWQRVAQYGITENRYFLTVLTLWLAGTALYFVVSRGKNIKMIPGTLCIVALATSFGPWGAYRVSERSQVGRLQELLVKNDILVAGSIQSVTEPSTVSFDDRREISAVLRYLVGNHGTSAVRSWFGDAIADSAYGEAPRRPDIAALVTKMMSQMGMEYVTRWATVNDQHFNYRSAVTHNRARRITGYDYYINLDRFGQHEESVLGDTGFSIAYDDDSLSVQLRHNDATVLAIELEDLIAKIRADAFGDPNNIASDVMRLEAENNTASLTIFFNSLNGTTSSEGYDVQHFAAECFVKLKAANDGRQ